MDPRRYDDNGDSLNNVVVIARKSDKSSIDGYGAPDEFLNKISSLFGTQVFKGKRCFWLPFMLQLGACHAIVWVANARFSL
jgi:hypothetical protein